MSSRRIPISRLAGLAVMVLSLSLLQTRIAHAADSQIGGFVYVMTNKDSGNSVVVYKRSANGTLHRAQEVPTHGLGSGGTQDPLASQGALTLSSDGKLLFAVNAGSNEISVLGTSGNGLKFLSKA
jgi:6-phosphogluconolactonase